MSSTESYGAGTRDRRPGVGVRLLAAFLLLALLPVVATVIGWQTVTAVRAPLERIAATTFDFGIHDQRIRQSLDDLDRLFLDTAGLASGDATQRAVRGRLDTLQGQVDALLALPDSGAGAPLSATLQRLEDSVGRAFAAAQPRRVGERHTGAAGHGAGDAGSPIDLQRASEDAARQAVLSHSRDVRAALAAIGSRNRTRSREWMEAAGNALDAAATGLVATGIASSIAALLIAVLFVQRNVLRRLRTLDGAVRRLTLGEYSVPVPQSGDDELANMASALEAFRRSALLLRDRDATLARRTAELQNARSELDQIAHVASRDLKAPLRTIDNLANDIRAALGGDTNTAARQQLASLQGRVRELDRLLDALFGYARIGRRPMPPETVDLKALIESCLDQACPAGSRIELSGTFGRVCTWRAPLEQVLLSLVDNACKHDDRRAPRIRIECGIEGTVLYIAVCDNGPGIDPRYHEQIFGVFQTLGTDPAIAGSGMGLAIARKLVDTCGGSIAIESDPAIARGTRFVVRWPTVAVIAPVDVPAPPALSMAS